MASGPANGCAFALFDTPIGVCALVWRGEAVAGVRLAAASEDALRTSVHRSFPDATEQQPTGSATAAIAAIRRLLAGGREDFSGVAVDLSGLAGFERRVLEETKRIPAGETRTYGEIASALDAPGAARAVGRALGRNPVPVIIPCHRVLAASGRSGGFSAPGGASTKLRLLQIEGAGRGADPLLFDHLPLAARPSA